MKNLRSLLLPTLILAILLSACGIRTAPAPTSTPIPAPTQTPDPCAKENLPDQVQKVNKIMREFDDSSLLAANTTKDQLRPAIADLQRIRREAEDLTVPACLTNLNQLQLVHMNTVITTLISFMGGADQTSLNKGIALARQQHDAYTVELSKLLGLPMVASTANPTDAAAAATPTP